MARAFTKNSANYLNLGGGVLGALLGGAHVVCFSAFVRLLSLSTTSIFDNTLVQGWCGTGKTGLRITIDHFTSGGPYLRLHARSTTADAIQSSALSLEKVDLGTWIHVGGVVDFAGQSITAYARGRGQGRTSVTFGANAYTIGAITEGDMIGAATTATVTQIDGDMAEVCIWRDVDIGPEGFAALANGEVATLISPSNLVFAMRLDGAESPERDIIGGKLGTITGSVPVAQHPYIDTADDSGWLFPFTVAAGGTAFPWHYYAGQMSA